MREELYLSMQENIEINKNKNKNIKIEPDIIFNRYDIHEEANYEDLVIVNNGMEKRLFIKFVGSTVYLGCFLMDISQDEFEVLINYIFKTYKEVKKIRYDNSIRYYGAYKENAQRIIELPSSEEELHQRLSKKGRYNLKREKRIVEEKIGKYNIVHYDKINIPDEVMLKYFEFKKKTHKRDFKMRPIDYITHENVSDAYVMKVSNEIIGVALSCEQCEQTYFENFSYDTKYSEFSLGSILYDIYLCELIKKGKKKVYLGSDLYEYKKRYGSIREVAYIGEVYRNNIVNKIVHYIKIVYRFFYRKIYG